MLAIVDAHIVNGDDVWMLQQSRSRDLASKSLNDLLTRERPGQNHFQRDDTLETSVSRAINHPHPATRNFFQEFVIAEVTHRLRVRRGTPGITSRISDGCGGGKLSLRLVQPYLETAFQQAASAKALRSVRTQFGPTPRACIRN
jgi:hypothetical protein